MDYFNTDISLCDDPPAFVLNGYSVNCGFSEHKCCLLYNRCKIHISGRNWSHDKYGLLTTACVVLLYRRIIYQAAIYTDLL